VTIFQKLVVIFGILFEKIYKASYACFSYFFIFISGCAASFQDLSVKNLTLIFSDDTINPIIKKQ